MFFPSSSFFSSSGVSLLAPIGTDVCSCDRCGFPPSRPPPDGSQRARWEQSLGLGVYRRRWLRQGGVAESTWTCH